MIESVLLCVALFASFTSAICLSKRLEEALEQNKEIAQRNERLNQSLDECDIRESAYVEEIEHLKGMLPFEERIPYLLKEPKSPTEIAKALGCPRSAHVSSAIRRLLKAGRIVRIVDEKHKHKVTYKNA